MWKRVLILLEVVVLFAPATLLLFRGPIGALAALGQSVPSGLVLIVWVALGAVRGYERYQFRRVVRPFVALRLQVRDGNATPALRSIWS